MKQNTVLSLLECLFIVSNAWKYLQSFFSFFLFSFFLFFLFNSFFFPFLFSLFFLLLFPLTAAFYVCAEDLLFRSDKSELNMGLTKNCGGYCQHGEFCFWNHFQTLVRLNLIIVIFGDCFVLLIIFGTWVVAITLFNEIEDNFPRIYPLAT